MDVMKLPHGDKRVQTPSCSAGKAGEVLPVDIAALKAIAIAAPVEGVERHGLLEAVGRVCARDIHSPIDLPVFSNSAMDGYAVRRADLPGGGPWHLPVSGRLVAGEPDVVPLEPRSAVRIMTGAPLPPGADTVIMQEHCERLEDMVLVRQAPAEGKHVRLPGEDVRRGTLLVATGQELTARDVALLAACGIGCVDVARKVRIGLISTGSELVEPGMPLTSGQIHNSNRYYLRARLQRPWAEVVDHGILADDPGAIRAAVRRAATDCDIVITTGGVSAGEEDHLMGVLAREHAALDVLKVAMRPGKPVTVGTLGKALYFGLPGNPYACAITFMQIAWPAIRRTCGLSTRPDSRFRGIAGFAHDRKAGRTEYLPVTWERTDESGRPLVERLGRGSSASLHPLALARAIAVLPADMPCVRPGDMLVLEPVDF